MKKRIKRYLRTKISPAQFELPMKCVPNSLLMKVQSDNLKQQIKYCAEKSPYYKRRFKELGIDPEKVVRIEDLSALTTPNSDVDRMAEEFLCRPPQVAFETMGTKGPGKHIYFTNSEIDRAARRVSLGFSMYGFTPADRFLNFYDFNFWLPGILHQKAVEVFDAFCLPAGKTDPEQIYERLKSYKITVLMGYPSLLTRLTELADKNGRMKMNGIMCGEERMSGHVREYIEDVWGCKVYMSYGCSESGGVIGVECLKQNGYHIDEADRIMEIVNPDSKGFGEIYLTTLNRQCMPLLRYKVGDIGRIETEHCECGLPTIRIAEIAGRSDDIITIGRGGPQPIACFEEALSKVPQVTVDFQIRAFWDGRTEVLELTAETDSADSEFVKNSIYESLKEGNPDLWKNYSLKMLDVRIQFAPPNSLRGSNIKLNKFIDSRSAQEKVPS